MRLNKKKGESEMKAKKAKKGESEMKAKKVNLKYWSFRKKGWVTGRTYLVQNAREFRSLLKSWGIN